MKNKYAQAALFTASMVALAFVLALITGCSTTPPSAVEKYLFDTQTNFTAVVSSVSTTNATTGAVVVNVQTNLLSTITQTPSVALQSWAGLASGLANTVSPGSGGIVGLSLLGAAGFFGLNRQRKLTAAINSNVRLSADDQTSRALAENFAQSIEVIREVLKTTPQGQALDVKVVEMLHRNQVSVGLIREAVAIVENTVSNEAAKQAAQKILSILPATPA